MGKLCPANLHSASCCVGSFLPGVARRMCGLRQLFATVATRCSDACMPNRFDYDNADKLTKLATHALSKSAELTKRYRRGVRLMFTNYNYRPKCHRNCNERRRLPRGVSPFLKRLLLVVSDKRPVHPSLLYHGTWEYLRDWQVIVPLVCAVARYPHDFRWRAIWVRSGDAFIGVIWKKISSGRYERSPDWFIYGRRGWECGTKSRPGVRKTLASRGMKSGEFIFSPSDRPHISGKVSGK